MFILVLEKAEEPDIKLPTSIGSSKKHEISRTTSSFALLTMPKPLTVWLIANFGKFLRDNNTRPPYLPLEKSDAGQEATIRTEHETDWFQIRK